MAGRRIGRWLLRLGIFIAVLLLLTAACVLFALGTDTGTRWTVALAGRWVPEFVQWESLSGRLAGPLELQGLEVEIAPVHLRAERIVLDWHPWGLIGRRVHFDSIRVTGALVEISDSDSVSQTDSSETVRQADSVLPALPVDLQIDRLAMVGATVSVTDLIEVYNVSVDFSGRPDAYDVAIAATAAAPEWHEVHVALAGQGDLESMRLDSLTAVSPAGQIELVGHVQWLPHPTWDVHLVASDIDPVAASDVLADWPGSLALRAHAEGAWSDSLILQASIDTIHGRLRSEPVQAKAAVQVSDDTYLIDDLHVLWGPVRLQADGIWSDTFNVSIAAEIPQLDQVVPEAAGSISIAGRGRGSLSAPGLVADVTASGLRWENLQLDQFNCTMDVTPGGLQPSRIDIDARGIAGLPIVLDSMRTTVHGISSAHDYSLFVWGPEGRAELSGAGVLADTTWNSRLTELEIESARAGVWQLVQPVEIDLAEGRAEWSPLCLETDTGMVCVAGQFGPEIRRLDAQIESLALNGLRPFMPEGWDLAGRLNADVRAQFDSTGRPRGALNIAPGPGWLALPVGSPADTIHYEEVRIGLSTDGDSLVCDLSLAVTPGADLERATLSAGLSLTGLEDVAFDSTLDLLRVLEQGAWSAYLQVANVRAEHLQGRGPDLRLEEPVSLEMDLSSLGANDLTGHLDLSVPPGAFEIALGDDTTMLHWEPSHAVLRIDSTGMHGDFQSALELDDTNRLGQIEAAATLPALTSLGALSAHQPLEASLEGQLDLAVLDAITRTFANTTGQVSVHVNVSGSTADAQLLGTIELAGRTDVTPLGIALEEVTFTAEGRKDGIEYSGGARSGAGRIAMDGRAARIPSEESPTTLHVQGTDFEILAGPQVQMVVSPDLDIRSTGTQLDITGEVLIPRAAIRVLEVPESAVQVSDDVVFVGPDAQVDSGGTIVTSRVQVRLGDDVHFRGFGFSSFLDGGLELIERPGQLTQGRGELTFREGRYRGFGQNLTVEPGRLLFDGPVDNPGVDVTAFRIADDRTRAGFKISGTIQLLVTETFSEPPRTRDETMSYILFGRPLTRGSESDQMRASDAAAVVGGSMLAMQAATKVGLDDARIEPGTNRNDAAFFAGKYLSPRLYVAYGTGIYESINTLRVRYILSRNWTLQAETGTREAADIVYQIERGD